MIEVILILAFLYLAVVQIRFYNIESRLRSLENHIKNLDKSESDDIIEA